MENQTSKHFVLQLGAIGSLYVSIVFLTLLLFSTVNIYLPDAIDGYWTTESDQGTIRLAIAVLVVFFPAYIYLTRLVNKNRRVANDTTYVGLTKWLIYISLFVGGAIILGDLATVIYKFLEGEITTRFIVKALLLLGIIGITFNYYIKDLKGYWLQNEKQSLIQGAIMSGIVLLAIVVGFTRTDTPNEVREFRLDERQVTDLQMIQSQIENYIRSNNSIPTDLSVIYTDNDVPQVEGREPYEYKVQKDSFSLCATFASASRYQGDQYAYSEPMLISGINGDFKISNYYDWNHKAGYHCFLRKVSLPLPSTKNIIQ